MKKKIMLLGGNYFQMTATKAAKELGCHVISVDYLPENPAHQYADEYYNVSTTDKDAVLRLASSLQIDGIVSYASDVAAPTAAYVAEQLNLPTNPSAAVEILTHKDKMRNFMERHGFLVPKGRSFSNASVAKDFFQTIKKPAMVKPVDASGSKGVSKINEDHEFAVAWNLAKQNSRCGMVIVEEFIERDGYQIAGDGFIVNGVLSFAGLMNEHFDALCNPLVPIGESYPSVLPGNLRQKALTEIQRLLSLLKMQMGAINLDFIVDKEGNVYILEIGPRNGGNLITDVISSSGDIDLAKYTILSALGEKFELPESNQNHMLVSSYIVHSLKDGVFESVFVDDSIEKDILRFDIWAHEGERVSRFDNGGLGIGAALMKHPSIEVMCERMDHMEKYIRVCLQDE